ncbi:MAG: Class peptide chain release factor [Gemmatimonadetes bacterium]|nr:Class peptide chain release factor [Gemmatimonadota bacterium]
MTEEVLPVNEQVSIPRHELSHRATRSGGAGGQHVNTSSTRIELLWDLPNSTAVDDETRERLKRKLVRRLDSEGMLRVVSSEHRSQGQNRAEAEKRLANIVRAALMIPKARRKTKPTRASKEERLTQKKRRGEVKRNRRPEADA